jgi:hypothetical protein
MLSSNAVLPLHKKLFHEKFTISRVLLHEIIAANAVAPRNEHFVSDKFKSFTLGEDISPLAKASTPLSPK